MDLNLITTFSFFILFNINRDKTPTDYLKNYLQKKQLQDFLLSTYEIWKV
jgi:hypothetical protein